MDKDFDNWNLKKKELSNAERAYFHKGDIWFASISTS